MPLLPAQSTTVKDYAEYNGYVYIFSESGVDIYKPSFLSWERIGYAALENVTSGDVNDMGIFLGTSDNGVWHTPYGIGSLSGRLRKYYGEVNASFKIESDNIVHVAARGLSVLVTHDLGVDYMPEPGTRYIYVDEEGCGSCAINDTYIAYNVFSSSVSNGIQTIALPTADWEAADTTPLNTGTTPSLSNNTIYHMIYGSGDNLFLSTGSGLDAYDYSTVSLIYTGSVFYSWATGMSTQTIGDIAFIDNNDDVIIYNITNAEIVETHTGTYNACYTIDNVEYALYDNELELHTFIRNLSPQNRGIGVSINWTLYFEVNDTINGINATGITVLVNGVDVTTSLVFGNLPSGFSSGFSSGFGGNGNFVSYTPATPSAYRKKVVVVIMITDNIGDMITQQTSFTTETIWRR